MARIVLNPSIRVISGDMAGMVYRQQADGSITVAKIPLADPEREPTEPQTQHMQRFRDASARATRLLEEPGIRAAYEQLVAARGPMSRLRATVIGDILKAPFIRALDLSGYHGAPGGPIRILAEDNVGVSRLSLSIRDLTSDQELESAEKIVEDEKLGPSVEWQYTAHSAAPAGHELEVRVAAYDLAGNRIELSQPVLG